MGFWVKSQRGSRPRFILSFFCTSRVLLVAASWTRVSHVLWLAVKVGAAHSRGLQCLSDRRMTLQGSQSSFVRPELSAAGRLQAGYGNRQGGTGLRPRALARLLVVARVKPPSARRPLPKVDLPVLPNSTAGAPGLACV